MSERIITLGREILSALIRGTDAVPVGDHRDIEFMCRFPADAINAGGEPLPMPRIRVTVSGRAAPSTIVVQIVPPSGAPERLYTSRRAPSIPWARPLVTEAGTIRPALTRRARRLTQPPWMDDDPFADNPEFPPLAPDPPGGGGGGSAQTYVRELDPATDPGGIWRVHVRNQGWEDAQLTVIVDHPETVQDLHTTEIPFQLINRAFREAMLALGLRFKVDNGHARISFDAGLKALTGLDDLDFEVTDRIQDLNLEQYTIDITNDGSVPAIVAGFDLEERGDEIGVPGPDLNIANMAIALRILLVHGYPLAPDFFSTAMRREPDRIVYSPTGMPVPEALSLFAFLDANPQLASLWAPFADAILAVTGSLGFTAASLDEYIQDAVFDAEQALNGALRQVGEYFYEVIAHLAERSHLIHDISADHDGLIVRHHRWPSVEDFLPPFLPDTHEVSPTNDDEAVARVRVAVSRALGEPIGNTESEARDRPAPAPASEPAAGPKLDALGQPAAHRSRPRPRRGLREGEIDHIVFLMLENRSFDHMLGYRGLATTNVNGLTGAESNLLDDGIPPYRVFHLTKTYGIRSPDHRFDATLEQIGGGRMDGFVRNYHRRPGVVDPSLVMSYYTGAELPMYDFLVNNFAICDNWHSSHPGETQCNRFCAITGQTPELDNLDVTDPRLAYYDRHTIFDSLTDLDVDWVYAEGNVAFLRMFDRYRIDIEHVIPFRDDFNQGIADTFEQRVIDGRLPSVSFVDPRYIDIPPQWDANDDLPPADVCRGQALVRHLYRLLSHAEATWARTLLVITYDEHGGFYDHSPPIGTPLSVDPNPVPRVHPDGAEHLGVRVPTFVVTPWIDAGTVLHNVFDHTSIIKTILERFAPDFPIADVFGPRAAAANDLLADLRHTARVDKPEAPDFECTAPIGPAGPAVDLERAEYHTAMRLLAVPERYRGRVVV